MRVEELFVHHHVERVDITLDHRAEALVLKAEYLLFVHLPDSSFAVCTTRRR
jgi:hypothetical protein